MARLKARVKVLNIVHSGPPARQEIQLCHGVRPYCGKLLADPYARTHGKSPAIGEDNVYVLAELLGYGPRDVDLLRAAVVLE